MDCVLLVRRAERRGGADGAEYVQLLLGDRTGSRARRRVGRRCRVTRIVRPGRPVHITGRSTGRRASSSSRRCAPRARHVAGRGPARRPAARGRAHGGRPARARRHRAGRRTCGALLDRFFGEGSEAWARYRQAPAAKFFHQAYRHGLLEHSLTVAQAVERGQRDVPRHRPRRRRHRRAAARHRQARGLRGRPGAHRPHRRRPPPGRDPARLLPVRRAIEETDGFPPRLAEALLHIILAHHGSLEHGTPVVPCTREATLVHFIDNLGGRLGSFDRLEKSLAAGERWSALRPRARRRRVLPGGGRRRRSRGLTLAPAAA